MSEKIIAAAAILLAGAATWFALKPDAEEPAQQPGTMQVMALPADEAEGEGQKISPSHESYTEGLKYFQANNYEKAKEKWEEALRLDPGNTDAAAGLDRIEKITAE